MYPSSLYMPVTSIEPQVYHPLFVYLVVCAINSSWFIKLAFLRAKLWAFKTE